MIWLSLTKPRIVFLLLISGIGAFFAAGGGSFLRCLGFTVSLICMAASASVMNCYYDRVLDDLMERTANRPLPSGKISPASALWFGIFLLIFGSVVGILVLPIESFVYLVLGFGVYVFLYTALLKRRHWLGVVLGGSAGSFPVLAGWTAAQPLQLSGLLMAAFVFAWTPAHAWCLEFVFRDEYEKAGIPTYPVVKDQNGLVHGLFWAVLSTVFTAYLLIPITGPFYDGILYGSTPMFLISYWMFMRNCGEGEAAHAFFTANLFLSFLFVGWAVDGYLGHPQWWGLYLSALIMPPFFIWIWQAKPSLGSVEASIDWAGSEDPVSTIEP